MKEQKFQVTGMTCASCSANVEKAVGRLKGVETVAVNLLANSMSVTYDERRLDGSDIAAAVERAGYAASSQEGLIAPKSNARRDERVHDEARWVKRRLGVSFAFLIPLFYISMGHMMGWPLPSFFHGSANAMTFAFTQFLLCLPIVAVNHKYFTGGFKALAHRSPNMDSLIAMGSAAALVYGVYAIYRIGWGLGHGDLDLVGQYSMDLYFESAGMILALITLGKFLEARSKGKTSDAIARLMELTPPVATVLREGQELELPVEQVQVGDLVVVRPGQSVPVDGEVVKGSSWLDESAITGESIPVEKLPGSRLTAATLNKSGYLEMRATRVGEDTTLSQIIRLVEEAGASKAPIAKLADKVSGIFVPVVIVISLVSALVWLMVGQSPAFAISIGIAVLVISCPCALGLATPTAIMVGTGKGAEQGVLFKSAEALEHTHSVGTVVMDKTGTITEGRPRVTELLPAPGVGEEELLTLAASLEQPSEHPLAEAVVAHARERGISLRQADGFSAIPGKGVRARLDGRELLSGNPGLLAEEGVALGEMEAEGRRLAGQGKTPLYFAAGGRMLGVIAVADVVKPTSAAAIAQLERMGIQVVMLTGDNRITAEAIGGQLGLSRVVAQVLPQDKEREIRRLQEEGRRVAMVGDGINDAPALARADVGFAIGAGTDVAIESADVVLIKNDLLDVAAAIQLSQATIRNIRQNLFWAFFYNTVGIPIAAGVFFTLWGWQLNPMFAAAAMSLSSVCVVTNALRLRFWKPGFVRPAPAAPVIEEQVKGEKAMNNKVMRIEGMSCGHCSARVEQALNALEGVSARVDLEAATAAISIEGQVDDEALRKAVTDAGYTVAGLE